MTPRSPAIWLVVTLLSVIAPSAASTETLPGEIERDEIKSELRRYQDLVVDYRRGTPDVADRVLVWDAKRLRRVLASIDGVNDETRPWLTVRFKAAAMMHTDAALRLLDRGEVDATAPRQWTTTVTRGLSMRRVRRASRGSSTPQHSGRRPIIRSISSAPSGVSNSTSRKAAYRT